MAFYSLKGECSEEPRLDHDKAQLTICFSSVLFETRMLPGGMSTTAMLDQKGSFSYRSQALTFINS